MKLFEITKYKRLALWIGLFIILSIVIYIPVHRGLVTSQPYQVSTSFIMNSKDIIDILGSNVQCKLKIFSGYSLQYYVDGGDAEFDIYVSGDKGKGKVNIKLEKRNDKWQITMARLHTKKGSKLINLLR